MKLSRLALPLLAGVLFIVGCSRSYYASPPPPPPPPAEYAVPPMIEHARHEGFRAGQDDATRDVYNGSGYHPRNNWKYRDTPGYESGMGPFGPYQNAFRLAYLHGYDVGYNSRR